MKSFFNTIFSNQTEEVVTGLNKELKALYVYDKFINEDSSILLVTSSLYEANLFYKSISCYHCIIILIYCQQPFREKFKKMKIFLHN